MSTQRAEAVLSSEECSLSTMQGRGTGFWPRGREAVGCKPVHYFKYRGYKSKVYVDLANIIDNKYETVPGFYDFGFQIVGGIKVTF